MVTAARDDDALTWDGDDDPTLTPSPRADAPLPDGYRAVGRGSESVPSAASSAPDEKSDVDTADGDDIPASMGNAELITVGVFAGIYLLLSIGWFLGTGRLDLLAQVFLEPVAFHVARWLAVLAPALWFATTFLLTRGGRAWIRIAVLAAGAVLLVPWPFVLAGAAL